MESVILTFALILSLGVITLPCPYSMARGKFISLPDQSKTY
jgi:hypothetical protein